MKKAVVEKKIDSLKLELLEEVKSLKDLAKGNLPEVAKEYIAFKKMVNGTLFIISVLALVAGVIALVHTDLDGRATALGVFGSIGVTIGGMLSILFGCELISVIMQPRRTAIRAITTLFREG